MYSSLVTGSSYGVEFTPSGRPYSCIRVADNWRR
jgi:hypothetical protein